MMVKASIAEWSTWLRVNAIVVLLVLNCVHQLATSSTRDKDQRRRINRLLRRRSSSFEFTRHVYNASLPENVRGKMFAIGEGLENQKMGLHIPSGHGNIRFKIVQGDKYDYFKASSRVLGDFAFLLIRLHPKSDHMLNRELKASYRFLIKATFRRKGARNLETTAILNLKITDKNDLTPLFHPREYAEQIGEDTAPFTEITQVVASDADDGLNGQVYYSLLRSDSADSLITDSNNNFAVHPVSGGIMTLKTLQPGTYKLVVQAEDRSSRLFYAQSLSVGPGRPNPEATVAISVTEVNVHRPTIVVETKRIRSDLATGQLVAIVRVTDKDQGRHGTIKSVAIASNDGSENFILTPDDNEHYLLQTIPGAVLDSSKPLTVEIVAVDNGVPSRNATNVLNVEFVGGTVPEIEFGRSACAFAVDEFSPVDTIVGVVSANSTPANVQLEYSVSTTSGNPIEGLPFAIDKHSGALYLSKHLDYESISSYELQVTAKFGSASKTVTVQIDVIDSNDNAPTFDGKWTNGKPLEISRNAKVESVIGTVGASDLDSGENGKLSFRLSNENATPFLIDYYTGELKLHSPLPLKETSWKLRVRASDWGKRLRRESELTINVYVRGSKRPGDEPEPQLSAIPNNHSPVFTRETYEVNVREDARVGEVITSVTANDADWGPSAFVRYVLKMPANRAGHFTIDSTTGQVLLLKPLTGPAVFDLDVKAVDYGSPSRSSTAKLKIIVVDVNNNRPIFERAAYHATIFEETIEGSDVITVMAADDDENENGQVRYRLSSKTDDFAIGTTSGKITTVRSLDRETKASHVLVVTAYDLGVPSLATDVNVTVKVIDVNDNPPKCLQKVHKVQMAEDWPNTALVTCMGASDADSGENGRLFFELDPTRVNNRLPFRIDPQTGCVFIDSTEPLDFEKRPVYNVTVEVSDSGKPQFSVSCALLIELIDVNENEQPPVFEDFVVEANVFENEPIGTDVANISAKDPDDENARVIYKIVSGNGMGLFSVDGRGAITTSAVLDRESQEHYWLTVAAEDTATVPLTAVVHVYIVVKDQNDNAPRPAKPIYFAHVPENSPQDVVVVKVEATDSDDPTGENAVRYQITRGDPQSFFSIDAKTGYITTQGRRRLDRETQSEHELEVSITDEGEPRLSTAVLVVVTVTDTNDNAPIFKRPIYNFNVPALSNKQGGKTPLCRVFASDLDAGINAQLFYNITDGDSRFSIDERGEIYTESTLNDGDTFGLTVQATDMGEPHSSASTRAILSVVGQKKTLKNTAPTLSAADWSEFHLSDADSVGETIGLIEAQDKDGDPLWWKLEDGNMNDTFSLRRDTGELVLARPLEFSDQPVFELRYSVTDGLQVVNGKVKVHVSKSREIRPEFTAVHYKAQIGEHAEVGTVVATVGAMVPGVSVEDDSGYQGSGVSYTLHSADSPLSMDKFRVEPRSGNVVLVETLDHEMQKVHHLVISARHGSLVNLAALTVEVSDNNDNPPRFLSAHYEAKVFANAPVGSSVVTIQAHDPDTGRNAAIVYSISSGNEQGAYSLDPASGVISVADSLSVEFSETVLAVKVTDGGVKPLSDTATVRIIVVMHETSPPRFDRDYYALSVKESLLVGSQLVTVYAESAAGVRYSIESSQQTHFDIHPSSGAIYLTTPLDRELADFHNFTVIAEGSVGGRSIADVQIAVIDANDHAPVFVSTVYRGQVLENMSAGTAVVDVNGAPLAVSATDQDSGPNALINYAIVTSWAAEFFSVDFGTGALRTKKALDFEKIKSFEFTVRAFDMGSPAMTSVVPALIMIDVLDANDETPVINPTEAEATLSLPTVKGVILHIVRATDLDSTSSLHYAIKGKKFNELFEIDSTTGTIKVATDNSSAFEDKQYTIPIVVSDGVHSADGTVVAKVVDYSDSKSSLRFAESNYLASVVENTTSSQPLSILSLSVLGAELGEHITYKWLNPRDEFLLNQHSGELKTTGVALDRELEHKIMLIVQASDERSPARVTQTVVTVTLQDINDCAPFFVELPYYATVPLDSNIGEKVISVKATDRDEGKNGLVRYKLTQDANGRFEINSWDGRVTAAEEFQSDMASTDYMLIVEATDQGSPPLSAQTEIIVSVVNRAMPVFKQRFYKAAVVESAAVGSLVGKVVAVSNVEGNIGYIIADGDYNGKFDIDFKTGAITVQKTLDRELIKEYNLTIAAVDVGREGIASEAYFHIEIGDTNDNAPSFGNRTFTLSTVESSPVGTVIQRISADDPDQGENGLIVYQIKGNQAKHFDIDQRTGDLFVARPMNFETKSVYEFQVVATDGGQPALSSSANVVVNLLDVNDEPPKFAEFVFASTLTDDGRNEDFVAKLDVRDEDTVSNLVDGHRVMYSVMDGDQQTNPLFKVDKHTGVVRLNRDVDLDDLQTSVIALNVSATDGVFTAYAKLQVTFTSTPTRTTPPSFDEHHYVPSIKENEAIGTPVVTVRASGGTSPLNFYFGGKDPTVWPVSMDESTGKVFTRVVLDYEQQNEYRIPVMVRDGSGRKGFSTLTLNVLDQNDNAPVFVANSYATTVSINATHGHNVIKVFATDPDAGDHVEYSMFNKDANEDLWRFFKMHRRRGQLSVRRELTQLVGQTMSFFVRATDRGNPPKQAEVAVSVEIVDDTVVVPEFTSQHFRFSVSEGVAISSVVDKLQLTNETAFPGARFSILPPHSSSPNSDVPFAVDKGDGSIRVIKPLDTESVSTCHFAASVQVGKGVAVSTVTIVIEDVNDNAPTFETTYEKVSVAEDAPIGTSVTVFSATDPDQGTAGKVTFALEGQDAIDGSFRIDPESGWLIVSKQLDRETKSVYKFVIRAADGGQPVNLHSTSSVTVTIEDANDCSPQFNNDVYSFQVDETAELGTVVGKVNVEDEDLAPNNEIKLHVIGGDEQGVFGLRDSGELFIAKLRLSYDHQMSYSLKVLASDGPHSTTANVQVQVKPIANRRPTCEEDYRKLTVSEDAEVGSEIFLLVTDVNQPNYSLAGQHGDHFAISSKGSVLISKPLDREQRDSYDFVAMVGTEKNGCSTRLQVNVLDVNDVAPKFEKEDGYAVTVLENLNITSEEAHLIVRLKAVDGDTGMGGRVKYALGSEMDSEVLRLFRIGERSGALVLTTPLDRERTHQYNLTVIASDMDPDRPLSSTTSVIVNVADVNDNAPVFDRSTYAVNVTENEPIGFEVVKVRATGGDLGEKVTYQLVSPPSALDIFNVDSDSGVLSLKSLLDFETEKAYSLTVEATDSGTPPITASTTVDINVIDANDHPPRFMQSHYKAQVLENSNQDTKIIQLTARDEDSGSFGSVVFSLTSNSEEFTISEDGWLIVKGPIDREAKSAHRLIVEATDGGDPPLTDSAAVSITVMDVNDNAPMFDECNLTAVVQEGTEFGRQLLTVIISDDDADPNSAPFSLTIEGTGAEAFKFDGMVLRTASKLDHSKKDMYLLTAVAKDSGKPGLSSECPLTIYVKEESKHPPTLKAVDVSINSLMGEFPGAIVARAAGMDLDAGDMLRYSLVEQQQFFTMDSESGDLTARHGLMGGVYRLNVSVTDGKFTTTAPFTVEVIPIDHDALDHAVSIRFASLSGHDFVAGPKKHFEKAVARSLNVRPKDVLIISIQEGEQSSPRKSRKRKKFRHRHRRDQKEQVNDLDVLFAVSKGKEQGYFRPNVVRQRLQERLNEVDRHGKLQVAAMTTEVCRRDLCVRGECRDRLYLDDFNFYTVVTEEGSFVAPKHVRTFECLCRDGFGGKRCDIPVNVCSRDPCVAKKMCIPKESPIPKEDIGYQCVCPPGTTGDDCGVPLCPNGDCTIGGALSFKGNGYLEYVLAAQLDKRFELTVELKTFAMHGVIAYGAAQEHTTDFHSLELDSGYLQYRWNCGAGEGKVRISDVRTADGKWHVVKVSRRGRRTKITLDDTFSAEGESPEGNEIINLRGNTGKVVFGAQVEDHPTLQGFKDVRRGFNGCLNRMHVDGWELPKTKQGLKMFNVELGCDLSAGGVCSSAPCQNFGSCVASDTKTFSCACLPRFTGTTCEIDLQPCASNPCPKGIACENLFNDFYCLCSAGFTGKTCQMKGDFDECVSSPCGPYGQCINVPGSYVCNCTHGYSGQSCRESPVPNLDVHPFGLPITLLELIIIAAVLVVLALLACCIICVCRKANRRYRYHKAPYMPNNNDLMLEAQPHAHNPLVSRGEFHATKLEDAPPPLPPRGGRGFQHRNSKLSNLESAQMTGLPTVQVRPLSVHDRRGDVSSDSNGSSCHGGRAVNGRAGPERPIDLGGTPVSCRRVDRIYRHPGDQPLHSARNYGSAAEELEQLGRFADDDATDILRSIGKPVHVDDPANIDQHHPTDRHALERQQLLAGIDTLSMDTIDRLKGQNHGVADGGAARSMASSIQCLPTDDHANGYHWDYADWASTCGQNRDDDGNELPQGVSALEETDSEFIDNEDCRFDVPPMINGSEFTKELLKLQALTQEVNQVPGLNRNNNENGVPSCSENGNNAEYMTMRPAGYYQRHLDKYLPSHRQSPGSNSSQRKPLLANEIAAAHHSDSDGAGSTDAVVQYGFPAYSVISKKKRRNGKADADRTSGEESSALYDEPPRSAPIDMSSNSADVRSRVSSFKSPNRAGFVTDGKLSKSGSDLSGNNICDIDDSEYAHSETSNTHSSNIKQSTVI